jgi:hypothetical protein
VSAYGILLQRFGTLPWGGAESAGGMAERSNAVVLKITRRKRLLGSNPSPSAPRSKAASEVELDAAFPSPLGRLPALSLDPGDRRADGITHFDDEVVESGCRHVPLDVGMCLDGAWASDECLEPGPPSPTTIVNCVRPRRHAAAVGRRGLASDGEGPAVHPVTAAHPALVKSDGVVIETGRILVAYAAAQRYIFSLVRQPVAQGQGVSASAAGRGPSSPGTGVANVAGGCP